MPKVFKTIGRASTPRRDPYAANPLLGRYYAGGSAVRKKRTRSGARKATIPTHKERGWLGWVEQPGPSKEWRMKYDQPVRMATVGDIYFRDHPEKYVEWKSRMDRRNLDPTDAYWYPYRYSKKRGKVDWRRTWSPPDWSGPKAPIGTPDDPSGDQPHDPSRGKKPYEWWNLKNLPSFAEAVWLFTNKERMTYHDFEALKKSFPGKERKVTRPFGGYVKVNGVWKKFEKDDNGRLVIDTRHEKYTYYPNSGMWANEDHTMYLERGHEYIIPIEERTGPPMEL